MHYYKFNIADWHLATSHLSITEEAVYFKLINFYYDTELPIPLETESVIRRLRLKGNGLIVKEVLQEFFVLEADGWHHQRCDSEISKYHSKAEVNREVGKLGGRPKKINDLDNPSITDMVSENNPQITLTTNHKPLTINQEPLTNINTITPEGVSNEVFKDFCKLRKGLKAPVTQTAINGLAKEGQKANLTLEQVMMLCCQNGWRGFKAEWIKEKKTVGERNSTVMSGLTRGIIGGNKDVRLLGK